MMSHAPNPIQEHIAARTAKLAEAYNNKDISTALTMLVDNGLDYSDYGTSAPLSRRHHIASESPFPPLTRFSGVNALNMTKAAFATFLHSIFDSLEYLHLKTIAINGTKDLTPWQWEWEFVKKAGGKTGFEDLDKGDAGQMLRVRGCSVTWWNEEDKVVKNCDYACFV